MSTTIPTTCPVCLSSIKITPKGAIRKHTMAGTAIHCFASAGSVEWAVSFMACPPREGWVGMVEQAAVGIVAPRGSSL